MRRRGWAQEVLKFQADFLQQAFPEYGFHGVGREDGSLSCPGDLEDARLIALGTLTTCAAAVFTGIGPNKI